MSRRKTIPARPTLVVLGLAVVGTLILSGCGVSTEGDFDRGKQLFAAKCSQCHTLKDAGSTSTLGPDLDAAFAQARASGMDPETVAGVVKDQVQNPRPQGALGEPNPATYMPADLVTGSDLEDVAHYLGTVAGNPEIKGPQLPDDPGAPIFAQQNCAGCHTLEAADATGTVGPDLDEVVPNNLKTAAAVREAIVKPNKDIAPGFPPNVMPQTYGQDLSPKQLDDLVQFVLKYSGQKKGGSGGGSGQGSGGGSGQGSGGGSK